MERLNSFLKNNLDYFNFLNKTRRFISVKREDGNGYEQVENGKIILEQVKMKFGSLRVYFSVEYPKIDENLLKVLDKNDLELKKNHFASKAVGALEMVDMLCRNEK